NARTIYKEYSRQRGSIVAGKSVLAESTPTEDLFKYQRSYPHGELYAPLTGYYATVFGSATGLESAMGPFLSGTSDQLFFPRISDLLTGRKPQGASVELTIDPKVQQAAWDALGDQRGAVVALDPKTGAVLAMVSKPSYDPNKQVSLADALRISCNTAFGNLGMTLGAKALSDQAEKFGFGRPLQIPLPVTPSSFPQTQSQAQVAQASIGQFDVRATPLQMAMV